MAGCGSPRPTGGIRRSPGTLKPGIYSARAEALRADSPAQARVDPRHPGLRDRDLGSHSPKSPSPKPRPERTKKERTGIETVGGLGLGGKPPNKTSTGAGNKTPGSKTARIGTSTLAGNTRPGVRTHTTQPTRGKVGRA